MSTPVPQCYTAGTFCKALNKVIDTSEFCGEGTTLRDGVCRPEIECGPGTVLSENKCVVPASADVSAPSVRCDECDTYACTPDGKYLYGYYSDQSTHTYASDELWTQADEVRGIPAYTTSKEQGCFAGDAAWPRILKDPAVSGTSQDSSEVPTGTACDRCDSYKCDANGKYLYTYKNDTTTHTFASNQTWMQSGVVDGVPVYTTSKENGCYAGDVYWPRVQI